MKSTQSNIAFCAFELTPRQGKRVQLFPHGNFRATDGRPVDISHWRMDAQIAAKLIEAVNQRQNDLVIDYEHQTLLADDNGKPAPAAGWFKDLEYVDGVGLFAVDTRWTETAEAMIDNEEYKYISPFFKYVNIFHAGITNFPAIDGMQKLQVMAAKYFSTESTEDNTMDKLLLLLGLTATATEEEAIAACKAVIETNKKHEADIIKFGDQVAALKTQIADAGEIDISKFVSIDVVEELKTELASLKTSATASEVNDLVDVAMSEGKLLPAQEEWAIDLGNKDVAALKSYIEKTPAIAALKGRQTNGKKLDENGDAVLSEADLAVCKNMGIDPEEFKKTRKQELASA